jgi:hypothetical protein
VEARVSFRGQDEILTVEIKTGDRVAFMHNGIAMCGRVQSTITSGPDGQLQTVAHVRAEPTYGSGLYSVRVEDVRFIRRANR